MKYTSPVYSQASGSIGGLTYSRNRGGLYTRARAIPSNPSTAAQQTARTAVSAVSTNWGALSDVQRAGWELYAQSVPLVDRLGAQIQVSGINMFIRCNVPRIVAGYDSVLDAPDELSLGQTPAVDAGVIDASAGDVTLDGFVEGAGANDLFLVSVGRPVPLSRTPAHEPTHFIASAAFTASAATTTADGFYPFAVGQKARIWARVSYEDGRLSPWAFQDVAVTA
jgi:hypothetical protein